MLFFLFNNEKNLLSQFAKLAQIHVLLYTFLCMHTYLLYFYVRTLGMFMTTHTCIFRTLAMPPAISYKSQLLPNRKKKMKENHITTISSFSAKKICLQSNSKHISLLNASLYKIHFLELKVLSGSCSSS